MTFTIRSNVRIVLFVTLCVFAGSSVRADEVYTFVVKKQEEKAKTRWSLQQWLDTRDRMRLMDLWLALHSPSPYEFYVGGEYAMPSSGGSASFPAFGRVQAGAYASIFGLELQRELGGSPATSGFFHLRVFGFHAQATQLTLEAGIRARSGVDTRNAVAGALASVYLHRFFGLDGFYRHHFETVPGASGTAGTEWQGGAFIDFRFLRIYGNYFSNNALLQPQTGFSVGTRLFF